MDRDNQLKYENFIFEMFRPKCNHYSNFIDFITNVDCEYIGDGGKCEVCGKKLTVVCSEKHGNIFFTKD